MHEYLEYRCFVYIFNFIILFYFLLGSGRYFGIGEVNVYLTAQSLIAKVELSIKDSFYYNKSKGLSLLAVPSYTSCSFFKKRLSTRIILLGIALSLSGVLKIAGSSAKVTKHG